MALRWARPARVGRIVTPIITSAPAVAGRIFSVSSAFEAGATKEIKYTSDAYPNLKQNADFAQLTAEHVKYFQGLLKAQSVVVDSVTTDASDDIEPFNSDRMRKYRGQTRLVLKPENKEEVSKVLKYCNENKLAVVPQGGHTGLVGGSVPVFDEIVINSSRMNKIRSFEDILNA